MLKFLIFNFNNEIVRLPIFGYGCAGGVLGLNRAIEIFKSLNKKLFLSVMLSFVV